MQSLKTGSSSEIYLCGYIFNGTYELEQKIHQKFKYAKIRGEWFKPFPCLIDYINTHNDMLVEIAMENEKLYVYKKMKLVT